MFCDIYCVRTQRLRCMTRHSLPSFKILCSFLGLFTIYNILQIDTYAKYAGEVLLANSKPLDIFITSN